MNEPKTLEKICMQYIVKNTMLYTQAIKSGVLAVDLRDAVISEKEKNDSKINYSHFGASRNLDW